MRISRDLREGGLARINRYGVRNHPDRIEAVAISGEDCECGMRTAHRKIIRPKHGKPYLGPLEMTPRCDRSEGRMVGLLPVKGKMQ
jgi:hypothetical protein